MLISDVHEIIASSIRCRASWLTCGKRSLGAATKASGRGKGVGEIGHYGPKRTFVSYKNNARYAP